MLCGNFDANTQMHLEVTRELGIVLYKDTHVKNASAHAF